MFAVLPRVKLSIAFLLFTVLFAFGSGYLVRDIREEPVSAPSSPIDTNSDIVDGIYIVKKVIDGDTMVLETGEHVRYAGIDAPETYEPFGTAAYNLNSSLVLGKKVRLEITEERVDLYGRVLAYVYQDDTFVNKRLIEDGLAIVLTLDKKKKPKYFDEFMVAQENARSQGWGKWAFENSDAKKGEEGNNAAFTNY